MKFESKLWLDIDGSSAGEGRIKLLELISETGSIKKAAEQMKMSYKAAWDAINLMNKTYDQPLIERQVGGKGGGGSRLTDAGRELVKSYRLYSILNANFMKELMNTNRIRGIIREVTPDFVIAESEAGDRIYSISTEKLNENDKITILIRPSDIILIDSDKFDTSAKNIFRCSVESIKESDKISQISLKTDAGTIFKAQITTSSREKLKISEGRSIFILFKTSQAIVSL